MLEIKGLTAGVGENQILKGIDLKVPTGEVHAIMGVNGSGKSTLANILCGKDGYDVTGGSISFDGEDLLEMEPDERAQKGMFMAFQYPVELPGVNSSYFLRTALNAVRKARGQDAVSVLEFQKLILEKAKLLELDPSFLKRAVNEAFSGGEKKRNEILQMAILEPKFCVLDETDSGLDIDALQIVSKGVNALRGKDRSMLIITHYQRLLNYIVPDVVHVMIDGKIVKSGGKELAHDLEAHGYQKFRDEAGLGA